MDFAENLENLKQDIANTLLKFNEDVFSKHKEYIERAEVNLKQWEEGGFSSLPETKYARGLLCRFAARFNAATLRKCLANWNSTTFS